MFEKIDTNNVMKNEAGDLPATTAILSNNQIGKHISRKNATILKNVFSATANGFGKVFYQPYEFTVLQDSYALRFKDRNIDTSRIHYFIVGALNKIYSKYDWGNKSGWAKVKEERISLPTKNSDIDFDFMERFISQLEAFRLSQLEAYLLVTGLKDYTLSREEEQILDDFENGKVQWGEFKVVDLFEVKNTRNILSRDIVENSGETPYLSASRENNAVSSYINYDEDYLDKGNCIFIGGKTFVVTYQERDFYSNDSHNLALYLKDEQQKSKLNQLFLASCIYKGLDCKYSWGDSISNRKIQSDVIQLPIKNSPFSEEVGEDYAYMQLIISAVQKLVIKDVVLYADERIAATKQVINKSEKELE